MPEISRRTLLAGAAFAPLADGYRIIGRQVYVWKHDPARAGPRASYRRCGRYVVEKLEPVYA